MDMSNFRPEIHVAQQSRRDKLRIHNDSIAQQNHHLGVYVNNLEQHHHPHDGLNYESSNPRNFTEICPGMLDFQSNQESEKRSSFENFYREIPTTVSSHDPQYFSTWKSVGSHSTSDNWVPNNQSPIFVGARMSTLDNDKPNYLGYQEFNSPPLNNPSGGDSMHCSSSLYQNALQELVTSSNVRSFERESRALSLSLSSVPSPRVHPTQIADRIQDSVTWKPSFSTGGSNLVSDRQRVIGGQSSTHRNVGPLGPFTGYSTILRVSKYLGPAEQLLDEHCGGARLKNVDFHEVSDKVLEEVRFSVGDFEPDLNGGVGDSGGSSFAFNGSTDSCQPENLQKKAKLIYMQDEVGITFDGIYIFFDDFNYVVTIVLMSIACICDKLYLRICFLMVKYGLQISSFTKLLIEIECVSALVSLGSVINDKLGADVTFYYL